MKRPHNPDPNRITLTLLPMDALYVAAALRYYVDTIDDDLDSVEERDQLIGPIRRNQHVLARIALALHKRGYGYVDPD